MSNLESHANHDMRLNLKKLRSKKNLKQQYNIEPRIGLKYNLHIVIYIIIYVITLTVITLHCEIQQLSINILISNVQY